MVPSLAERSSVCLGGGSGAGFLDIKAARPPPVGEISTSRRSLARFVCCSADADSPGYPRGNSKPTRADRTRPARKLRPRDHHQPVLKRLTNTIEVVSVGR